MIKVHCRTNLDLSIHQNWPEEFACRPEIGDRVASESGFSLKIVGITHCYGGNYVGDQNKKPYLIIELNH